MTLPDLNFDSLKETHDLSVFDCGDSDINEFLKIDAINYQKEQMANTYVFHLENKVIAFSNFHQPFTTNSFVFNVILSFYYRNNRSFWF